MTMSPWTDDRIADLKRLWSEGLSATEIARRLPGTTRNAVLGKLHRLRLLGGRVAGKTARARPERGRPKPGRRRVGAARGILEPAPPPAAAELAGTVDRLERLGVRQCRWPIGDPKLDGFSFCGRRAAAGPYCPAHRGVAYLPGSAKRDRRAAWIAT